MAGPRRTAIGRGRILTLGLALLAAGCGGEAPPAPAATRATPAPLADEAAADLAVVPYLRGYEPARPGPVVVVRQEDAIADGLNLYLSGHAAEAVLADVQGRTLHRWRCPLLRLWPELRARPDAKELEYWRRAHLFPDGGLLAIYEGIGVVRLDAASHVLWSRRGGFHHDLAVREDGAILLLERQPRQIPRLHPRRRVVEDFVTVLGPAGEVRERISLLESFERSPWSGLVAGRRARHGDIFHTNSLELLDGRLAGTLPAFRAGNLLVSVRELDALAVVDPAARRVVWALTGPWRRQHEASLLASGRLLLFDNLGLAPDRSRVIEVDPADGSIRWQFAGDAGSPLFSRTLGSCQRLANGNTLVVESQGGRALEVTPRGDVAWEFHNPHRAGAQGELVAALYDMVRLPPGTAPPGVPAAR